MPEGPELRYMSEFINTHATGRVFTGISKSLLATNPRKHPDIIIPRSWWKHGYTLSAVSRGKEMRITIRNADSDKDTIELLVRAGMSGTFIYKPAGEPFHKHAHLRFEVRWFYCIVVAAHVYWGL